MHSTAHSSDTNSVRILYIYIYVKKESTRKHSSGFVVTSARQVHLGPVAPSVLPLLAKIIRQLNLIPLTQHRRNF